MKRSMFVASVLLASVSVLEAQPATRFRDIVSDGSAGVSYARTPSTIDAIRNEFLQRDEIPIAEFSGMPEKPRGAPGVALFDYDRDGDLDIYVTNGPGTPNSLLANQLHQTGRVAFVDVARAAGVAAARQDSTGVCFGDIDNDGDLDLYVLGRAEPNRMFENLGDGTFHDITKPSGLGSPATSASCTMGDIDGDGLLDIAVGNTFDWSNKLPIFEVPYDLNEHNQLFLNRGGNVFEDVSTASGIENLNGISPEGAGQAGITWTVALVDFDQDGDVDLFNGDDQAALFDERQGGFDRGVLHLFENDGTGSMTDINVEVGIDFPGAWMGLSFGDLNCDGRIDFFGSNIGDHPLALSPELRPRPSIWYLGRPGPVFERPRLEELVTVPFGWGTSIFDSDNDGDQDILVHGGIDLAPFLDASNPGVLLLNDACSARFTWDRQAFAGSIDHNRRTVHGTAVGDLDGDGFLDIVSVSNFDVSPGTEARLYPALGSSFDDNALFVESFGPISFPLTPDLVLRPMDAVLEMGSLAIELNSGDNGNGWVRIDLIGSHGLLANGRVNRDGIGAVVRWSTGGHAPRSQVRPVLGGSSYASQDELTASFGLGRAGQGTVEVLWPGGVRNRLYDVAAFERLRFPEIPCSFDGDWPSSTDYARCVEHALGALEHQGVLRPAERQRFLSSAKRAFQEFHANR